MILATSCDREESSVSQDTGNQLERERDSLGKIAVGMSESDVLRLIGKPDETRIKGDLGIVAEKYRWVYGVEKAGEFPSIGSVVFDANDEVLMSYCPSQGLGHHQRGRSLPISATPQVTDEDLYCVAGDVFKDDGYHQIQVSVVNDGKNPFLYRHDNQGIRFSVMIELFDEHRTLLWREYLGSFHSPHFSDRDEWPVLRVNPGERVTERVPIFLWLDANDGVFYPGTYYVRVAFPLKDGQLFASNMIEFSLDEAVNQKQ